MQSPEKANLSRGGGFGFTLECIFFFEMLVFRRIVAVGMRKSLFSLAALFLIAGTSWADPYRVHYNVRGSGRDITVQAESSSEARRTVMDMFPSAVVTGVGRVKRNQL